MDELTGTVYFMLDEAFHGVKVCSGFVMVPLAPDPPVFARLFDAPQPTGRQFEIRVPVLAGAADRAHALSVTEWAQDFVYDGHLRCIDVGGVAQIELRHRVEAMGFDQHRLVQTSLRMSHAAKGLGPTLQDLVGGTLVRSRSNDETPESLGVRIR